MTSFVVIPALVAEIHGSVSRAVEPWIAGMNLAMTNEKIVI